MLVSAAPAFSPFGFQSRPARSGRTNDQLSSVFPSQRQRRDTELCSLTLTLYLDTSAEFGSFYLFYFIFFLHVI